MNNNPAHQIPGNHSRISPTAIAVAWARALSNIPFCPNIAKICGADKLPEHSKETHRLMGPYFEARFNAITNLVRTSGIKNILEIGSGVSPRSLIMSADPDVFYIETDLPEMLQSKRDILAKLCHSEEIKLPTKLRLAELNALDRSAFLEIVNMFPPGPVVMCNEGVMAYFPRQEKEIMAQIIHETFVQRPGSLWITPDIFLREDLGKVRPAKQNSQVEQTLKEIADTTKRTFYECAFVDAADRSAFFEGLHMQGIMTTIGDVCGSLATAKMGLDEEDVQRQLSMPVWTLWLKQ